MVEVRGSSVTKWPIESKKGGSLLISFAAKNNVWRLVRFPCLVLNSPVDVSLP